MALQALNESSIKIEITQAIKLLERLAHVNTLLGKLDVELTHSKASKQLMQLLSLQESVESTKIEGLQVTFTDMMESSLKKSDDSDIIEIQNYMRALQFGYESVENGYPVTTRLIKQLHEILMKGSRGEVSSAGEFRKIQNFIGPTNRLEDAYYIPVEAHLINEYMENLEKFINTDSYGRLLPQNHLKSDGYVINEQAAPLLKTGIMHAQFESIHPFLDGNGRLGRILIVLYLLQQKVITHPIFFVSEELEKEKARYYDLLNGVRGDQSDWGKWLLFFVDASERMATKLLDQLNKANRLLSEGEHLIENEAERKLWITSFEQPILTVAKGVEMTGYSPNTVRKALHQLVEKELLYASNTERRNRKYRNYALLRIFVN